MESTALEITDKLVAGSEDLVSKLSWNSYEDYESLFPEARETLNNYLTPFPKPLRKSLVQFVKEFKKQVEDVELKNLDTLISKADNNASSDIPNDNQKVLNKMLANVSSYMTQVFQDMEWRILQDRFTDTSIDDDGFVQCQEYEDDVDENRPTKTASELDEAYLFRLICDYLTTSLYKPFAQLAHNAVNDFPIKNIMDNYTWITTKHIDVRLNEDNEEVRICMYTAIRALSSMDLSASPYDKMDCISAFLQSVCIAVAKSVSADSVQHNSVSADDLLPAVVYLVLKSKAVNIAFHLKFIESWIGKEEVVQTGAGGYAFTTLYSALEVIKNLDIQKPLDSADSGGKFFLASVEIIHKEVSTVWNSKAAEIAQSFRKAQVENMKLIAKQISDAKEQKAWKVIKWIPGLNFTYGGIRGIYYKVQKNNKEAMSSLIGSCGGVLGLGAGIAGALVGGPIIVPIIVSIISGSATNQVVTGGGEVLYEVHQNSDHFLNLSMDNREKEIYDKIIKDIAIVGLCYSSVRAPVYLIKGNKAEAKHSGLNAAINAGASAAGVAAGYGLAKLAASLGSAASSAAEAADDVVKPITTEIMDLLSNLAVKAATSASTTTAARMGTTSLVRLAVEGIPDDSNHQSDMF